ncbi:hypothetical protein L198_07189 [Cryptococcus wingfieldii CBS 7118]|uniref:Uncharacterized protein n=1 Tax=Cryptococcus wingfieldii CBS 7118 TaxID=1295528 RepID=A0A1E3IFX9_9TREE|nr:hypothetical protein L198_07189 [Cryptococcus wingfieldii CBS 7118]ODN86826.1 hypothetical protein L198_07189 [Cryptococcus wingfieldii CBS 7118]
MAPGKTLRWVDEALGSTTMTTTLPPSSRASSQSGFTSSHSPSLVDRIEIAQPARERGGLRSGLASFASAKATSVAERLKPRPYSELYESSRRSSRPPSDNVHFHVRSSHHDSSSSSSSSGSDNSNTASQSIEDWVDQQADLGLSSNAWPASIAPTANHYVSGSSQSSAPRIRSWNSSVWSQPQMPPSTGPQEGPRGILKRSATPSNGPWSSAYSSSKLSYGQSSKSSNTESDDIVSILRSVLSEALSSRADYNRKPASTYVSSRVPSASRPSSSHFSSSPSSLRLKVNIYNNSGPASSSSGSTVPSFDMARDLGPDVLERRRIHAKRQAFNSDVRSLAVSYGYVEPEGKKLEGTGPGAGRRLGTWND